MSILRRLFGPSQEEVWRRLCEEIGADFEPGGFWRGHRVVARVKEWTLTLDTVSVNKQVFTRLRAPYVNPEGFRFTLYRKSIFSGLGKALGMQDIEIGEAAFDEAFIIQGNSEPKIRALLSHAPLRELIVAQQDIRLTVRDDEGWFGAQFPEGVDELHYEAYGIIRDVDRLKSLYKLFALTLHCLCHLGAAYERDPQIRL